MNKAAGLTISTSILATLLFILLTSCAPGPSSRGVINRQGWSFTPGTVEEVPRDLKNRSFTPVGQDELTNMEPLLPENKEGVLWLRREFTLPSGYGGNELSALLLGRLSMADKTYLNGQLIGHRGAMPPRWFSDWNSVRCYPVPDTLLKEGTNEILIQLWGKGELFQQGPIDLGPWEELKASADQTDFFSSQINALVSILIFVFGLYHMLVFAKRPRDRENLYYGIASLAMAFYSFNFFITRIPGMIYGGLPYLIFQKLIFTAELFSAFGIRRFIREFLKRRDSKFLPWVEGGLLAVSLIMIWSAPHYILFKPLANLAQIYVVLTALYTVYSVVAAGRKGRKEALVLLVGITPFLLTIFYDLIVHQILEIENSIYLAGLGFPLFLLAILFILASRFVQYHNEVEDLNIHLEHKVAQRTSELKNTNDNLSRTLGELQEAQATAERDMKMAVMIQQGLYQHRIPPSSRWEISHYFQPMAGVSGDLYDYYVHQGELRGVALFDVSGHGIASGLITMIAKSVSERNFMKGLNKKLGTVLQNINQDMIHEIGKVENYVTGILLRLTENKVEYANAGHTELLLKRGRTGEVIPLCPKGKDIKGLFLGIEGMESTYGTLSVETQVDDTLLLYTDCLTECPSLNRDDREEFGMERLSESFAAAPKSHTDAIRDHILKDLREWRGSEAMDDDLTFIVMRRKRNS